MKVAIIGESYSGKSTLLRILAGEHISKASGYFGGVGTFMLEDQRLIKLKEFYNPRKITFVHVECFDFEGFGKMWRDERAGEIRQELVDFQAFIHVLPFFGNVDPVSAFDSVDYKILLSDLEFASRRLKTLEKEKRVHRVDEREVELLQRIEAWLSEEKPLFSMELTETDQQIIRGYNFISLKPQILIVNKDENRLGEELPERIKKKIEERKSYYMETDLELEEELSELSKEEIDQLMKEYGLKESVKNFLVNNILNALGMITFFTVNEREGRAWVIPKGSTAKQAAGKIHSDMERGFIRAEVIHFDDFIRAGSEKKAREMGLYKLEGKDYIVQDGDILFIRFSV